MSDDEGKTWRRTVTLEDKAPPEGFEKITALDTVCVAVLKFKKSSQPLTH